MLRFAALSLRGVRLQFGVYYVVCFLSNDGIRWSARPQIFLTINLPNGTGFYGNNVEFGPSVQFEIAWPQGGAPAGLPFTPTLNPNSLIAGQNVATPIPALQTVGNVIPLTSTVTLEPQAIDATVVSVTAANGQMTYQVNLSADDFIAFFGPAQNLVVYTTAQTHTITTSTLTSGSMAWFRGLLFDVGGTLRMVAMEIEDGVAGP